MSKKQLQTAQNTQIESGYNNLLQELQSILDTGLTKAYKAVDNIKVQTYWQIGERIVREELQNKERARYGEFLIENLAVDLGISKRNLHEIVQFYNTYPIVRTLSAQLSWSHYTTLIRVDNEKERQFYEQKIIQNSWSVRTLREQIKSNLYRNTSPQEIEELSQTRLPETTSLEVFRNEYSAYDLNFLPMKTKPTEKDIEDEIVKNIDLFLKEMGEGFSFTGRQVPVKMGGQTHYIDLVLFHKGIPCTILVDLKNQKIDSRDVGQMNKYVSYWRDNCQYAYEKPAIGLILCREVNKEEAVYALKDLEDKIFVATYKTKLPNDERLKQAVKKLV